MGKGGGRFHSSLSREERKEREKREKRERGEREKRERRETKERQKVRAAARDRRFSSSKHASLPPQSRWVSVRLSSSLSRFQDDRLQHQRVGSQTVVFSLCKFVLGGLSFCSEKNSQRGSLSFFLFWSAFFLGLDPCVRLLREAFHNIDDKKRACSSAFGVFVMRKKRVEVKNKKERKREGAKDKREAARRPARSRSISTGSRPAPARPSRMATALGLN